MLVACLECSGRSLFWALVGAAVTNRQWMSFICGSVLVICLGLLIFNPDRCLNVGFSGVFHVMLMAGAISEIRSGRRSSYILLILVVAKLGWEHIAGPLPGSEATAGGMVIVDAHFYGGLCGVLLGGLLKPILNQE